MPELLAIPGTIQLVLWFIVVGMQAFAFADAAMRPAEAFPAANKQTKIFWMIILGLAVAVSIMWMPQVLGILPIAGAIAAAVYLAGVRPAVKEITTGRQNEGPYGPW